MTTPTHTSEPLIVEEIDTSEAEIPVHFVCRACYPSGGGFFTSYAVCGALLLGIDAPAEAMNCDTCDKSWEIHKLGHLTDGE